jgi:hypothetical protein
VRSLATKFFAFLATSGFLLVITTGLFRYVSGEVVLEYIGTTGRGYEFQLRNESPVDKTIVSLRIAPPTPQAVVYKTIKAMSLEQDENGNAILPGGTSWQVPAAVFKDLDGHNIQANSTLRFRVPPLVDNEWVVPGALKVDVPYATRSSSWILERLEALVARLGSTRTNQKPQFIVIDNYWMDIGSQRGIDAMQVYCRENDSNGQQEICRKIVLR